MTAPADHPLPVSNASQSSWGRLLLAALGLTTIDLFWVIKPGVEPSQYALYHWSGPARLFFAPMALDMLAAWLIAALLILAARRAGRVRVAIWTGLLLLIPWFIVLNGEFLFFLYNHNALRRLLFAAALALTFALTFLWRPAFSAWFERVVSAATTILFFAGIFGLFLFLRLGWYGLQAHRMEQTFHLEPAQTTTVQPHRLIWIVFDELSYHQVYEHRYPGVEMPAFDRMAAESTVFSHTVPNGLYTEFVLPGLLSGETMDEIRTSSKGEFSFHRPDLATWETFNQHNTSFQDARNDGYGTAVAGWYNPYCRLLPAVLDQCMWSLDAVLVPNGMVPAGTIWSNTLEPVQRLGTELIRLGPAREASFLFHALHVRTESVKSAALHVEDYKTLYAASTRLLLDRSAGFVLLHLPVPHPAGIYDRKTGQFSIETTTYMDNLALTDKCLAGFRKTLEDTGQWDSSTIVIMGDHGWRTTLWHNKEFWSRAEQQASDGGVFDQRPVYLVKLPGQTVRNSVDTTFRAVNTRKLFDAILLHKINTTADLNAWLKAVK
jgi:hypothetical protein